MSRSNRLLLSLLAAALGGCASGRGTAADAPPLSVPAATPVQGSTAWPVRSREHVDLWLHGLAMVMDDTTRVPLFRRSYRD